MEKRMGSVTGISDVSVASHSVPSHSPASHAPRIDGTSRPAPRIAFKAKGSILFLDLAEILAVQAEGNYVSLRPRTNPHLVHESLSSMAEKLKPYGFIRIHRSVVVNISAVEEIQPLPTGEYRLRVKGGKQYLVTRTYKHNLRDLAQLWIGSERLCG
jgi:DNA-binding LytR/AlgR family response regulator